MVDLVRFRVLLGTVISLGLPGLGLSQSPRGDKPATEKTGKTINQRIVPIWSDDTHFSFSQQSPDGSVTIKTVDANTGEISIENRSNGEPVTSSLRGGQVPRSRPSAVETEIEFVNESAKEVELHWIDTQGSTRSYGRLQPGSSRYQHTYSGHAWMVNAEDGSFFGSLIAESPSAVARIKQTFDPPNSRTKRTDGRRRGNRERSGRQPRQNSPDGKAEYRLRENRLDLRIVGEPDSDWIELEVDQTSGRTIVSPTWSPDSKVLAVWSVQQNQPEDSVTIESSPSGGGRARVNRRPYRLPGDPYDHYRLVTYDASTGKRLATHLPVIDFNRPRIRWFADHKMAIEKVDRGHQRVRLFVIDPIEETTRIVVDESSETFIWTSHGSHLRLFTYLDQTDEVIYASESSGYRHLYLIDLNDEQASPTNWNRHAITSGNWLVREILELDQRDRTIYLSVGEYYDDQDPYHQHLVRVRLDGEDLTAITDSDGDHSAQFSPDHQFVVVTHSRVDSPPVHELRRVTDGKLVTELMHARRVGDDRSASPLPKIFHAKGRDGQTEIWGALYFPADFDPKSESRYPVIERIYAGPHDAHVPKRYVHSSRFEDLTSLGFVVVQIDGMGTANRSKAFHDRCWHDLKDAGFPDRIAWMKQAAKQFPSLDISRVGIFGTSAGGQNACGALLFHGDFYQAAYASCGCHDNRMDKASWNEQWMGYPVDHHYAASSNIENAARLEGDLFLMVGELDQNVPPESTYRLVDALVKADKDFEFLMIPGMGHSDGGKYGRKRMREFFVRTLKP